LSSVAICFEISATELKSILPGMLKQLCVPPGVQGPAPTAVIADMAAKAVARAVAIQALILSPPSVDDVPKATFAHREARVQSDFVIRPRRGIRQASDF